MAGAPTLIVSQNRNPTASQEALAAAVVAGLAQRPGLRVLSVAHLYDLPPGGPAMQGLRAIDGDLIVLAWMYPRSAYWVLRAHGVAGHLAPTASSNEGREDATPPSDAGAGQSERRVWCLDLRNHAAAEPLVAEILALVDRADGAAATVSSSEPVTSAEEPAAARWYPVIDRERCNNCGECLNFCLFGVFAPGGAEGVAVEVPDACRNGCPACSRVCPEGAILFPQHHDPAIAGDPAASRAGLKLDLSQLFAGGDDLLNLAQEERATALAALADMADMGDLAALAAVRQSRADAAGRPNQPAVPTQTTDPPAVQSGDPLDRLLDGLDRAEL